MTVLIEQHDNPAWTDVILRGLRQHNREQTGSREVIPLNLAVRDESGAVIGGLLGESIWGWLLISTLWVSPDHRKAGLGKRLMLEAERIAQERGCRYITLETFSFQALPFYRKLGYLVYGQLDDFPAGQTRYSLKKDLQTPIPENPKRATGEFQALMYQYDVDVASQTNPQTNALYNIIIDLLKRRDLESLLQKVVDYAARILKAPYGEIMLLEGDELVVRAFTRNQPYLMGDRVKRGQSLVSWRAFDSQLPVLVDDYLNWSGKRVIYDTGHLRAVADFPILSGDTCIGVLAMGRTAENHIFTQEETHIGMQFAQLIAVVLDNMALYTTIQTQNDVLMRTNSQLLDAQRRAEDASRMKSQFLASMSHELRTPLNAIIGYSQLLTSGITGDLNEEQRSYQERIFANAQHLIHLINEVLDLSKIEAGKTELLIEPFNLHTLLTEIEGQNRVLAQAKRLTLEVQTDATLPTEIVGDKGRIKQILINLLSNAIKFTDRGGVSIKATGGDETTWRVTVTDTGKGIPAEQLDQIFDEFRQLDAANPTGGTGLGLAITKKLIELMGGTIQVQSEFGRGSSFTITLPIGSREAVQS